MTSELVKKLKDAGFWKQKFLAYRRWDLSDWLWLPNCSEITRDYREKLWIPNLSELIEACEPQKADNFWIETELDGWEAGLIYFGYFKGWPGIKRDEDGMAEIDERQFGSTPEEAVANLWLELNTKKRNV